MFVAGEHCDVDTLEWSKRIFKVPVLDHWWQTGEWFKIPFVKYSEERFSDLFPESEDKIVFSFHEHLNICKKKIQAGRMFFERGLKSDFRICLGQHCKSYVEKKVYSGICL